MSKVRLEAFTDGVFAIAATLLILHVTADAPGARLGRALTHAWPQYAAYVLAFVMIGIWWVNHHAYMMVIDHVDRTLLLAHIFFLVCIAFTPFPTSLVAEHFHDGGLRAATFLLGLTMTGAACAMSFIWLHSVRGHRLIVDGTDARVIRRHSRDVRTGVPANAAVTLLALWLPYAALGIFATVALFYVFGGSLFERA